MCGEEVDRARSERERGRKDEHMYTLSFSPPLYFLVLSLSLSSLRAACPTVVRYSRSYYYYSSTSRRGGGSEAGSLSLSLSLKKTLSLQSIADLGERRKAQGNSRRGKSERKLFKKALFTQRERERERQVEGD